MKYFKKWTGLLALLLSLSLLPGNYISVLAAEPDKVTQKQEIVDEAETEVVEAEADSEESGTGFIDVSQWVIQEGGSPKEKEAASESETDALSAVAAGDLNGATNAIYNGLKDKASTISLSSYRITRDDAADVYWSVLNSHPELFYVTSTIRYSSSGGYVTIITPTYRSEYTDAMVDEFNSKVNEVLSGLRDDWSDAEKALYLHDWLVTNCEYDTSLQIRDAYQAIVKGTSVCEGYALAYEYLLQQAGLEGQVVTSNALNHEWNLVSIGGQWYYVDCTWDDPTNRDGLFCKHGNFLRSREGTYNAKSDGGKGHVSTDWVGGETAENVYNTIAGGTDYDSFIWSETTYRLPQLGLKILVISGSSGKIYDFSNGSTETYNIQSGIWYAWGQQSYYTSGFPGSVCVGDKFYYSTQDSIYSLMTDGQQEKLYSLSSDESSIGYIYGLSAKGNTISYYLKQSPNDMEALKIGTYTVSDVVIPTAAVPSAGKASESSWKIGEKLVLTCATGGARIYYTLDGSTPTLSSSLYDANHGLVLDKSFSGNTVTLKAIAAAEGYNNSSVATYSYTVVSQSRLDIYQGNTQISNGGQCTASEDTEFSAKLYDTDGSLMNNAVISWSSSDEAVAVINEGKVSIKSNGTTRITATGKVSNGKTVTSGFDLIVNSEKPKADPPTASVESGSELKVGSVIRLSSNASADIYYTLDSTSPTRDSAKYNSVTGIPITEDMAGTNIVIKAIAVKEGYEDSTVATFTYKVADSLAEIRLSAEKLSITPLADQTLTATVTDADGTEDKGAEVTWNNGNPTVLTLTPNGQTAVLKAVSEGTSVITASVVLSGKKFEAKCTVTVSLPQAEKPSATPEGESELNVGDTVYLYSGTTGASIYYTFDSTSPTRDSAKYNSVTGIPITEDMAGTSIVITAIAVKDGYKDSPVASFRYEVQEIKKQESSALNPVPDLKREELYLVKKQSFTLTNGKGLRTTAAKVVSLTNAGKLTAKGEGRAELVDGSNNTVYKITVIQPEIAQKSLSLICGETGELKLSLSPGLADLSAKYPVFWTSSSPEIATAEKTADGCLVNAISAGTATITACINGQKYTSKVKVANTGNPSVTSEKVKIELAPLQSITLKLKGKSFQNVGWTSSLGMESTGTGAKTVYYDGVAHITAKGKLTAAGSGTTTLYCDNEVEIELEVKEPTERTMYMNVGQQKPLKFYNVKNVNAEWSSEDAGSLIAADPLAKNGTVKALKAGEAEISCFYDPYGEQGDGFTYNVKVFIENPALVISAGAELQPKSQYSYTLNMSGNSSYPLEFEDSDYYRLYQPVLFKSSKPLVAYVDEYGVVHTAAVQKRTSVNLTCTVNQKKITVALTVLP
ncbi:MAG: chitobiase/beta-hexosaminidase C-terminal domain-containing protein [Lachnospiraceae bacterium]|nr:chitobiase/beta-hexosaminidase C-terminal domain-containing protein [Lachnospiraceae bacterium]